MVFIDSGPVEAEQKFRDVPKDKWYSLVLKRRFFLERNLSYDCRCLVEFCEEAAEVFHELEYDSPEHMIREGYALDPIEIELAVAWLKHNEPDAAVSLDDVSKSVRIKQLRDQHPDWTQQQIADEVGVTKGYISQVFSKTSDSEESLNIPEHLSGSNEKADFRKLPEELQQQVAVREISLNKAAIQSGIRKKKTPEELALYHFKRCDNRLEALHAMIQLLDDFERKSILHLLE